MKRKTILLSGLIAMIPFIAFSQDCASPGNVFSFMFQGKQYEVVKELYSWAIASQCAVDRGGYLVQINSREEQDTVYQAIINGAKIATNYKPISDGGGASYVWIGATDRVTEGTWLWDGNNDGVGTNFWTGQGLAGSGTGAAIGGNFNNWGGASLNPTNPSRRMEPDDFNSNQDAAGMALSRWPALSGSLGIASEWNDLSTSNTLYFVIEYDSASGTHPDELRTQVTVFPNPATDHLTITSAGNLNPVVSVRIYNILGSVIYHTEGIRVNELSVSLLDYQSGAYIVHVELAKGESVRRKIMIR